MENVIRHRNIKSLHRGRKQKRGTADSAAEQGVPESAMVDESSEEEVKADVLKDEVNFSAKTDAQKEEHNARWKRILLLIVAVTVHNVPEGKL